MTVMRCLATGVVSASSCGTQAPLSAVCVCARFFRRFVPILVCVDMEGSRTDADMSPENDGCPQIVVETTLALVKPDAIHRSEEIEDVILRAGFSILRVRTRDDYVCQNSTLTVPDVFKFVRSFDSCVAKSQKNFKPVT